MNNKEFLWYAKRGRGECIIELKKGRIFDFKYAVKKVLLNNLAFCPEDEFRSAFACELISFFNNDCYYINLLWKKIIRTELEDFYTFDYLLYNLYFLLKRNNEHLYDYKIGKLLSKRIEQEFFSLNENKSICSLISLCLDLKLDLDIIKIIKRHYDEFSNSNLDLSLIGCNYDMLQLFKKPISNIIKPIKLDKESLVKCISDNSCFKKQLPFLSERISKEDSCFLLSLVNDCNDHDLKTNILKLIYFGHNNDKLIMKRIISYFSFLDSSEKVIAEDILCKTKSKLIIAFLLNNPNFSKSLKIRLLIRNYNSSSYAFIHKLIKEIKIDYKNSWKWYEIENDLINHFKRKNPDLRFLNDIKYFLNNGLCSISRFKLAIILEKYNFLDKNDIESLRYDAYYKNRNRFRA